MSFVKTGNPNSTGSAWKPFATPQGNVQVFTPSGVQESLNFATDHQCEYWLSLDLQ